ncbi:Arm DNA-binding domain-containing protein [Pinibacter soli]|uniref:Arm DNA-binding domain-containing protein n=1 Tax=Pinibacter soli TaxID=3044211 RepID=A0ABT6RFX1_9BACT|nr:Arm DNA-binding domain-containing protein [Pinibacter soli]MDI3321433.1 Arm DNA-binding domain-containing protein [Pinibacter soli]
MQVLQKLSFLIYLKKTRKSDKGIAPVYVRIRIDGLRDEIATGISLPEQAGDAKRKEIRSSFPNAGNLTKRLIKIQSDLEQHFNILQAQLEVVALHRLNRVTKRPLMPKLLKRTKRIISH